MDKAVQAPPLGAAAASRASNSKPEPHSSEMQMCMMM